MKRKTAIIFLLTFMMLAIAGIVVIITSNFDVLKPLVIGTGYVSVSTVAQLIASVLILAACWVALFIVFVRQQSGDSFLCGKKDALTGIGTKQFLKNKYKHTDLQYQKSMYVACFAFDTKELSRCFAGEKSAELQKASAKLLSELCEGDDTVARINEGTFAMILCCDNALQVQKRILDIVEKLNLCEYNLLHKNAAPFYSGFCFADRKNLPFESALKNAITACEFSSVNQVNTSIFSEEMAEKSQVKNILKTKLLNAIKNEEFIVYLQLIYSTQKNGFVSAEALSRWNSPSDGIIMPAQYIKEMHESGVIETFDMYMLEKTCAILQQWENMDDFKDLSISCNVTRATISSKDFLENLRKIAKKYRFNHNNLLIEITEDAIINDQITAHRNLTGCCDDGYRIALDDFGAGNSSFSDLDYYPFQQIKIDRRFITMTDTQHGVAVLDGLIKMAHCLDVEVVCEGVETSKQCDVVSKLGCDLIQGHFYSYLYPVEEAQTHYLKSLSPNETAFV